MAGKEATEERGHPAGRAKRRVVVMETRLRTVVRSLTWRAFAATSSVLVAWYFTGSLALGATVGLVYNLQAVVTHYVHDRLWARSHWGLAARPGARPAPAPEPEHPGALLERMHVAEQRPIIVEWASD